MPSGEHLKSKTGNPAPNGQLYQGGALQSLFEDQPKSKEAFFNQKEPNLGILHEKPEHRYMLWMKAQGASNREIAHQTGYTEPWLSQLFRQPWAQERLAEMLRESGKSTLDQTLMYVQSEVLNSLQKLVEVRDDPETPKPTVRNCCVDIIEQFLGKPKQKTEVTLNKDVNIEDVDEQIKVLEAEEKRLRGEFVG